MNKPLFITFTGVDGLTDVEQCVALSQRYPVEFGFLFSTTRDDNRYSGMHKIVQFVEQGLSVAVHLCGAVAREAMTTVSYPMQTEFANRVQVNLLDKHYVSTGLIALGQLKTTIQQSRNTKQWPDTPDGVYSLLDCSGGRGTEIKEYPATPPNKLVGYAGGFRPGNVKSFVDSLHHHKHGYWIDMETGVRTDDWFDLDKCRQVCEEVYGI